MLSSGSIFKKPILNKTKGVVSLTQFLLPLVTVKATLIFLTLRSVSLPKAQVVFALELIRDRLIRRQISPLNTIQLVFVAHNH